MKEATRSCAAVRLLALVLLIFPGSSLWADQRPVAHLALDFQVRQGEITIMESRMRVQPGNDAEMTVPGKHGGEYRVAVSPRLVGGDDGTPLAHVKVDLFKKKGHDWNLLASPELRSTLDRPAQMRVTLPRGADGLSTEFSIDAAKVVEPG